MDIVDQETRSRYMSGIRGKNTKPELVVRKLLHARGYRYRLHVKGLEGRPDLVLPKYKAIIFVHGCFWHMHNCNLFKMPQTNQDFWSEKLLKNKNKDKETVESLMSLDWRVCIVWECALRGSTRLDLDELVEKLEKWINSDFLFLEI